MKHSVRSLAVTAINNVVEKKHSLTDSLTTELPKLKDSRDQALLQAICFGVCRWYSRLDAIAKHFLEKPLKAKDQDVYVLILIGLYQLIDMRIPEYAAVTETVRALKKTWAKGLVNGILRRYIREANTLNLTEEENFSHPHWMIEKLKQDYPKDWENILTANNQHPPFSLRVNQRKLSREDYLKKLVTAEVIPVTETGIIVDPMNVQELPGFVAGEVSVQDGGAQLAAELLQLLPHQRVLDACAAPGGKTAHILEREPSVTCVAVDHDPDRVELIKDNLQRLTLSAECVTADVSDTKKWWDGKYFDRILLDAPCSASGVIRRHPDIKLLRYATDIVELSKTQLHLLNSVWALLKPGGLLLYATCSIFPDENVQVLKQFLTLHPEAKEEKIHVSWGRECEIGRQILPGMHNMDGFYYGCLRK